MKALKALAAAALVCCLPSSALAEPSFKVIRKSGSLFVKGPFATRWEALTSDQLRLGTMLRVDPEAQIQLRLEGDVQNLKLPSQSITLKEALITRLDEELIRKTQLRDYPLKSLWDEGKDAAKVSGESPLLSFSAAFVRGLATLMQPPLVPPIPVEEEPQTKELAQNLQDIPILTPGPDAFVLLTQGPALVPLVWEAVGDQATRYKIFVWEDLKAAPVATVAETWFELTFEKPGIYSIQIEDTLHRYRSATIQINVDRDVRRLAGTKPPLKEQRPLKAIFPQPQTTVVSKGAKFSQNFLWSDATPLTKNERYRLTLLAAQQPPKMLHTRQSMQALELRPGSYRWYVERIGSKSQLVSETRSLQIRAAGDLKGALLSRGQLLVLP